MMTTGFGEPCADGRVSWLVAVEVAKAHEHLRRVAEARGAAMEAKMEALAARVAELERGGAAAPPEAPPAPAHTARYSVPLSDGLRFVLHGAPGSPASVVLIDVADALLYRMRFMGAAGEILAEVPPDVAVEVAGGLGPAARMGPGAFALLRRGRDYELVRGSTNTSVTFRGGGGGCVLSRE